MHQPVRNHAVDADAHLASLIEAAANAAPHSPDLDRLIKTIDSVKLPKWEPSNAATQVHDRRHHEKLGEIVESVTPKVPTWKKLITKEKRISAPKLTDLSEALLGLARYNDETALSLKVIEREEKTLQTMMDQMTAINQRLERFQQAISTRCADQVLERLTKAVNDKKNDIAHLWASYNYAKGSYFMARDSLNTSAAHARTLHDAITLTIKAQQSGKKDTNRLMPSLPVQQGQRKRDFNRIKQTPQRPATAVEELAGVTGRVARSLVHQENAITLMEETSRGLHGLSDPR